MRRAGLVVSLLSTSLLTLSLLLVVLTVKSCACSVSADPVGALYARLHECIARRDSR